MKAQQRGGGNFHPACNTSVDSPYEGRILSTIVPNSTRIPEFDGNTPYSMAIQQEHPPHAPTQSQTTPPATTPIASVAPMSAAVLMSQSPTTPPAPAPIASVAKASGGAGLGHSGCGTSSLCCDPMHSPTRAGGACACACARVLASADMLLSFF